MLFQEGQGHRHGVGGLDLLGSVLAAAVRWALGTPE